MEEDKVKMEWSADDYELLRSFISTSIRCEKCLLLFSSEDKERIMRLCFDIIVNGGKPKP